ncbi:Cro/CI family transcriptional regulator [Winslowiella arboricola]|uniref:Cro/CI family transcriptional regulator n=1 Tax=Winslowiella arboricola TaxID=2978220 RepID=UPI00225E4AC1|nr:Cro/CI family transcriptional regulator [Winslowiella arboricola]MCU5775199.1 Cro/CI family transcriptional regulator [Winslowiella arboricola]
MFKQKLIEHFGTATAAAKVLGVSKSTVSLWKEVIPWQYALLAEKATGGALKYDESHYEKPNAPAA